MTNFVMVRVPRELVEKIDRLADGVPRERWVRRLIEREVGFEVGDNPSPGPQKRVEKPERHPVALMVCPADPSCRSKARTSKRDLKCTIHDVRLVEASDGEPF